MVCTTPTPWCALHHTPWCALHRTPWCALHHTTQAHALHQTVLLTIQYTLYTRPWCTLDHMHHAFLYYAIAYTAWCNIPCNIIPFYTCCVLPYHTPPTHGIVVVSLARSRGEYKITTRIPLQGYALYYTIPYQYMGMHCITPYHTITGVCTVLGVPSNKKWWK